MNFIKVRVEGKGEFTIAEGSTYEELSKEVYGRDYKKYLGVRVNNEIVYLGKKVKDRENIRFIDISNKDGHRIYGRTLVLVYIVACERVFPGYTVNIEHSLGEGMYTEISGNKSISFKDIEEIKDIMNELIKKDLPIYREKITKGEAVNIFKRECYEDKVRLYNSMDRDYIDVYRIEDHVDTIYGHVAPSTGYLESFDLKYYYPGAILLAPTQESKTSIPEFVEQRKLAKVFKEAEDWANILNLGYLGSLNDKVINGSIDEVIRISEALHEKKIASIADMICEDDNVNLIMIAGPSSSGKTTFSKRLAVQLKVNGKRPIAISVDDYFVNREDTPKDEFGEYDFEAIEAIDIRKFNEDLITLIEGKEVELPRFNFLKGIREPSGRVVKIDEDHPIIVEGIHALNPRLTSLIPEKNKFKIYVSALTQLNIDSHNRIPTTDTRIIRRMVRDNKYRGNDVLMTFKLWEKVRKGEEKNIFPLQEEADIMFDSALVYELSILKKYAVPLLKEVDNSSEYYSEAKRLLKFLDYFRDIDEEWIIPPTSILREFIGGSCFR